VEILFDANNDDTVIPGEVFSGQWMNFTANGAWRDDTTTASESSTNFGPARAWFAATSKTTNGYQIEFVIQKSLLLDPLDGATLGFDVALLVRGEQRAVDQVAADCADETPGDRAGRAEHGAADRATRDGENKCGHDCLDCVVVAMPRTRITLPWRGRVDANEMSVGVG